jgi:hypothetical protein
MGRLLVSAKLTERIWTLEDLFGEAAWTKGIDNRRYRAAFCRSRPMTILPDMAGLSDALARGRSPVVSGILLAMSSSA